MSLFVHMVQITMGAIVIICIHYFPRCRSHTLIASSFETTRPNGKKLLQIYSFWLTSSEFQILIQIQNLTWLPKPIVQFDLLSL